MVGVGFGTGEDVAARLDVLARAIPGDQRALVDDRRAARSGMYAPQPQALGRLPDRSDTPTRVTSTNFLSDRHKRWNGDGAALAP